MENKKIPLSLLMKSIEKNELEIRKKGFKIYEREVDFLVSIGFSEEQSMNMVNLAFQKSRFFDRLLCFELFCQSKLESILNRINLTRDFIKLTKEEYLILSKINKNI